MNSKAISFLSILGAFLVVALLIFAMKHYTRPAPLNAARAEERKKALVEIRGADAKALHTVEVVDAGKGFIRVKIDTAMDLTVKEYQNPAAFRTNLTARADKLAEPPPKVEYE